MSKDPAQTPPERPRAEPEIIPPARGEPGAPWETIGVRQIYIGRISPLRLFLWSAVAVAFLALLLFLLAGALLIAIPGAAVVVLASVIAARWRGLFRR